MGLAGPSPRVAAAAHPARAALADGLRRVGVGAGDVVWFQICREPLGDLLADGPEALCERLYAALRDVVGPEGTILVPAFTFSFCRQQPFDPAASPTVSGLWNSFPEFPEWVRRLPGAVRSRDPIFSVAGVGPRAAELLGDLPPVCLGEGSVQARLRAVGGRIAILGVGLDEACIRHHAEAMMRVPWRFDKLFTGRIVDGGQRRTEGWIYNVRIAAAAGDPDGAYLERLARESGVCRTTRVGTPELLCVDAEAYYQLCARELARDPWCSARGPAGDPLALEAARVGAAVAPVALPPDADMQELLTALWRLPRDLVSEGYDVALAALATQLPMTIHEFATGSECWSWLVPEKWSCREAYLETLDGRRLFSHADHPLHVVSYSLPFRGEVSREELLRHLHVHPILPDAVPFIFRYYDRDWGLCCSRAQRDALTDERYRVVIDTTFSYGTLKVGEVVLPGDGPESVVLCAHLCHPHMANDDLTGVVVGMDVMRALAARPRRRYTYRFLVVPETIGSVAWLSRHEALVPTLKGGLFLEMLGTDLPPALQHSFAGDTQVDRCFAAALRAHAPDGWTGAHRTVIGNDERQFNAPGVRVPMLSLARVLPQDAAGAPYPYYHSDQDTPERVPAGQLERSRDLVLRLLDTLERDETPVNRWRGELFCARYGIHVDWYTNPEGHRALFAIMDLVDGTRSVLDIATACGISFDATRATLDELARHGLVEWR